MNKYAYNYMYNFTRVFFCTSCVMKYADNDKKSLFKNFVHNLGAFLQN